jgi:hypothetical protein
MVNGLGVEILTNFCQNVSSTHIFINHIDEWHKQHALCKINIKNEFILWWFLKYILPIISKDMTMTMLESEEETIIRAEQFHIFYS